MAEQRPNEVDSDDDVPWTRRTCVPEDGSIAGSHGRLSDSGPRVAPAHGTDDAEELDFR